MKYVRYLILNTMSSLHLIIYIERNLNYYLSNLGQTRLGNHIDTRWYKTDYKFKTNKQSQLIWMAVSLQMVDLTI